MNLFTEHEDDVTFLPFRFADGRHFPCRKLQEESETGEERHRAKFICDAFIQNDFKGCTL